MLSSDADGEDGVVGIRYRCAAVTLVLLCGAPTNRGVVMKFGVSVLTGEIAAGMRRANSVSPDSIEKRLHGVLGCKPQPHVCR